MPPPSAATPEATEAELRQLIAALEQSGMAAHRPDAAALLARSRALLRERQGLRPGPSARRVAARLGRLALMMLDGLVAAGIGIALLGGMAAVPEMLALLGGAGWAGMRSPALRGAVAEAGRIAGYHGFWAYDWFAEAFSEAAVGRLETRLAAREVMAAWRHHRRLLRRKGLPTDVEAMLRIDYAESAARAFIAATTQQSAAHTMRWSALMAAFSALAASGALRPAEAAPEAPPEPDFDTAPPQLIAAELPEIQQRRLDLREQIRRKRAEITTAYSWKLKTPAEIDQRELHVDALKAEIAALEREMEVV